MHTNGTTHVRIPRVLTVALPADFTDAAVDDIGPKLRNETLGGSWQEIRLDGRDVRYLSPRALGLLVSLSQLAAVREVRVVISGASPQLAAGLALGRLIDRIQLDSSEASVV